MYEVQEKQDFLKGTMTLGVSSVGSSTLEPSDKYFQSEFGSLFKLKGLLGVGAFGVVVLVKNRMTNQ